MSRMIPAYCIKSYIFTKIPVGAYPDLDVPFEGEAMKLVSGGQTGVDMAALEFARANGLSHGGWVPRGRMNEVGRIPEEFDGLTETQSADVNDRTRMNVDSSDATLVFIDGSHSPGTRQTIVFAACANKPNLVVDLRAGVEACAQRVEKWLLAHSIGVLNIAGPRASEAPRIGVQATEVLRRNLSLLSS